MKITYFEETDTALIEFSDRLVSETREISEDVYLDLDAEGHLVSMTVEHAGRHTTLPAVAVERVAHSA